MQSELLTWRDIIGNLVSYACRLEWKNKTLRQSQRTDRESLISL